MTPEQREQRARAYLEAIGFYRTWMDGSQRFDMDRPMYLLTKLLASTEQRVLEDEATEWQKCLLGGTHVEIQSLVQCLRQKAQEQRP